MSNGPKPFPDGDCLRGSDLETLRDWIEDNVAPQLLLGGEYRASELVGDLDRILSGMWSDGIDAMGEDA